MPPLRHREVERVKKKRRWIKWIILAAAVLLVVGWLVFFSGQTQSTAYTEVPVTQGDMTTYYNFDGLVHAPRTQTMRSATFCARSSSWSERITAIFRSFASSLRICSSSSL